MTGAVKLNSSGGGSVQLTPPATASNLVVTLPSATCTLLSEESGAADAVYTPAGTGAVASTVQAKLRESVSILDFGAIPNDSSAGAKTANDAAFVKAIASFADNAAFAPYSGGGTILIPQGTYYLSDTISISRQVILHGVTTPDGNAWSGSILVFPTGKTGIRIYDYRTSPLGTDAGGTTIENLVVRTTRNAAAAEAGFHGIFPDTRVTIRNCVVTYFGDCGINIVATAPVGNANNWRIDNVRCAENGFDGLYVDGADVNAGVAIRLDCSANLRYGIFDSSFLGNTYIGCHTASNVGACYKTDNANARNMLLGCYAEGGQPESELVTPTTVIGGIMDFAAGTTANMFYDGKLLAADGALATPSITFAADTDTGFYRSASGVMRYVSNGVLRAIFSTGAKFSTSGSFWASGQAAHEMVQDSTTLHSSIDYITSSAYAGVGKYINIQTATGTGYNFITATNLTANVFNVLGNGNVQNANNSYGAISDIKLKQDVVDATSQWVDVKAIRLRKYRFKSDPTGSLQLGVIAQELETVSPGLIEEVPDRDAQGELTGEFTKTIKYSVLLMKAVGALQEAQNRIESLEARLSELEAK